jgi:hypothetical protein
MDSRPTHFCTLICHEEAPGKEESQQQRPQLQAEPMKPALQTAAARRGRKGLPIRLILKELAGPTQFVIGSSQRIHAAFFELNDTLGPALEPNRA